MSDARDPQREATEVGRTLYGEVRRLAGQRLASDRAGRSLSATDFAHEILVRGLRHQALQAIPHAELQRRIGRIAREVLVDRARARARLKRGGGLQVEVLATDPTAPSGAAPVELVDLDDALRELEQLDPRQTEILEQRYFGGSTVAEVAVALGVSRSTVEKEERKARAWLEARLGDDA
ncbi:MAG: sigma-70 family RNA polymerase sigma factor [Planctomycetota bacterium]